jgi:hypothetical protein
MQWRASCFESYNVVLTLALKKEALKLSNGLVFISALACSPERGLV